MTKFSHDEIEKFVSDEILDRLRWETSLLSLDSVRKIMREEYGYNEGVSHTAVFRLRNEGKAKIYSIHGRTFVGLTNKGFYR